MFVDAFGRKQHSPKPYLAFLIVCAPVYNYVLHAMLMRPELYPLITQIGATNSKYALDLSARHNSTTVPVSVALKGGP